MISNYIKLAIKVLTRRKFFTFISLFGITMTLVVLVVATAILDDAFAAKGPEIALDRSLVRLSRLAVRAAFDGSLRILRLRLRGASTC